MRRLLPNLIPAPGMQIARFMTAAWQKSCAAMRIAGMEGWKAATGITGIMNSIRTVNITWNTTRITRTADRRPRPAEEAGATEVLDRGMEEGIADFIW